MRSQDSAGIAAVVVVHAAQLCTEVEPGHLRRGGVRGESETCRREQRQQPHPAAARRFRSAVGRIWFHGHGAAWHPMTATPLNGLSPLWLRHCLLNLGAMGVENQCRWWCAPVRRPAEAPPLDAAEPLQRAANLYARKNYLE